MARDESAVIQELHQTVTTLNTLFEEARTYDLQCGLELIEDRRLDQYRPTSILILLKLAKLLT